MLQRLRQDVDVPRRYLVVARRHGFEEELLRECEAHGTAGVADFVIARLDSILFIEKVRREAAADEVETVAETIRRLISAQRGAQ
jgi:hypothetical protein